MVKTSVVINTFNEERNIGQAIKSIEWADEIIVCDMHSEDKTVEIAKRLGAKIVYHEKIGYVEPARNFAINKACGEWILILDADEEIPESLKNRLEGIAEKMDQINYVEIPRKNIIFGKWMKTSLWWPDYHIRFFKKGSIKWNEEIHSKPDTKGDGIKLEQDEKWAIIHRNYETVTQFIERMNRYTSVQAKELMDDGVKYSWKDSIEKSLGEFLSRFFSNKGYKDGIHGLILSMLQALSFVVVYAKLWEIEKFQEQEIGLGDVKELIKKTGNEINYWLQETSLSKNSFKRFIQRVNKKLG